MTRYEHATAADAVPPLDATAVDADALASFLGANRTGPETTVHGVGALDSATADELAFCKYEDPDAVLESDAGIVVCPPSIGSFSGRTLVHSARPRADFVRAVHEFFGAGTDETDIHPSAVVEDGATIGDGVRIGAQVYVADCVTIGDGCTVGHGATLGGAGFGFARTADDALDRQVHAGTVVLEDDVAIGPNSSVDRAVFDETVVGRGTKVSGNVHLAHQVELGRDVTVAYGSGFAGGATVGDRTTVHPHVSVATDVVVGADAEIGMNAAVLDDVPAGTTVVGSPAKPVGGGR